jgi:hypothetical protein
MIVYSSSHSEIPANICIIYRQTLKDKVNLIELKMSLHNDPYGNLPFANGILLFLVPRSSIKNVLGLSLLKI